MLRHQSCSVVVHIILRVRHSLLAAEALGNLADAIFVFVAFAEHFDAGMLDLGWDKAVGD